MINKLITALLIAGCVFFAQTIFAQTNTWDGSSNANWNTAANWSLNLVPTAAHDVVIPNNVTVTITVNTAAVCNSLTINGGGTDQTLTISGANSLTVTNGVTINSGTGNGDYKVLAVNAGTLTAGSITIAAGASFNRGAELTISTGTVNVSGDITMGTGFFGSSVNDITFTGAGTLNLEGFITGGDLTPATGTVNFNGNNQTISSEYNYNNVTFSGSGDSEVDGSLTIGGDFTFNTVGSLDLGAFTHNIGGDWINDAGTFDLSASTINLNGGGQNIGGTNSTNFNNLTLSGTGTKTFGLSTAISGTFNIVGVVADLGAFTDHTANALSLDNVGQTAGTWGSSSSAAANTNDTFFAASTGIITTAVDGPTTFYSRQTGNWNAAATWSTVTYGNATNASGTFPQTGDIVNIGGANLTITVNVNSACSTVSFLANDGNSPTLAIGAGNTLDVSGEVSLPRTGFFSGDTHTLAVGNGTLNAASIDFSGGGFFGESQLTIGTGTVTVTGDISTDVNLVFPTIEFTGAGLLQVGGEFFEADVATLTAGTGTVEYNGSGDQTISNFSYNNLVLSGSGTKTAAGAIDINGDFTLGSGLTFTGGSYTHTLAGDWINNGATYTATGTTITFDGTTQTIGGTNATTFNNLTIDGSTTTLNFATTVNATFSINNGGVANLGTILTHTTKTLAFDGGGQTPGTWGSTSSAAVNQNDTFFAATSGILTVTNTIYYARQTGNWNLLTSWSTVDYGNITNSGTFPITGDIARIGGGFTITVTANASCSFVEFETGVGNTNTLSINTGVTLDISDAVNIATEDGDTNTLNVGAGTLNTVDLIFIPAFAGGAVSELTISTGTATITGNATNNGPDFLGIRQTAFIIFSGAGLLQVAGDFLDSDDGDLTASTGTVEYNGSSPQTIADFTYYNLTFNNTASSIPALTLFDDVTVTNTLNMTQGILNMNGFTLTLGNGAASTLNRTASTTTNWMYGGTFERYWPVSTAITSSSGNNYGLFPVGTSSTSSYRPVDFNSTVSQTGAGTVSVTHVDFTGTTDLSPFYDDAGTDIEVKDNSNFLVVNTTTGGTYDVDVTMTGLGSSGTVDDYRLAISTGSTTVTAAGTHAAATGTSSNPTASRTGVTSAELDGDWRITSTDAASTPLPVELISFEVEKNGIAALLTWATAQEINNDHFEIEHSIDGLSFETIGEVDGNGTINTVSNYSYTHRDLKAGFNYYRLKQVDFDGQFEYSEIKRISLGAFEDVSISIYPNPSDERATVQVNDGIATQIELITLSGTILKSIRYDEGMSSHTFDVTDLKSGIYLIRVQGPDVNTIKRLMVK